MILWLIKKKRVSPTGSFLTIQSLDSSPSEMSLFLLSLLLPLLLPLSLSHTPLIKLLMTLPLLSETGFGMKDTGYILVLPMLESGTQNALIALLVKHGMRRSSFHT